MSAQTNTAVAEQREEIAQKVEKEILRKANLGDKIIHYNRALLLDLPQFDAAELLLDDHYSLIDRLIDKHGRDGYTIRIQRIVGYASEFPDSAQNLAFAQERASEAYQYILDSINLAGIEHDDFFINSFSAASHVIGFGEYFPAELGQQADHPRYRRVEILYNFTINLPAAPGSDTDKSTMWKIDFGPAGSGFFFQGGVGTLTMLPDGMEGPASPISKSFKFEQLGVSVGLFGKFLKNKRARKFIKKFPLLRRLLHDLHPRLPSNYKKTSKVLGEVGFSVDAVNEGGEFSTVEPLSFDDLRSFKYYTLSASLSILGKGEVALILLHDTRINIFGDGPLYETRPLFAFTMIFGFGANIAVPDLEAQAVPLGFVQLTD